MFKFIKYDDTEKNSSKIKKIVSKNTYLSHMQENIIISVIVRLLFFHNYFSVEIETLKRKVVKRR